MQGEGNVDMPRFFNYSKSSVVCKPPMCQLTSVTVLPLSLPLNREQVYTGTDRLQVMGRKYFCGHGRSTTFANCNSILVPFMPHLTNYWSCRTFSSVFFNIYYIVRGLSQQWKLFHSLNWLLGRLAICYFIVKDSKRSITVAVTSFYIV